MIMAIDLICENLLLKGCVVGFGVCVVVATVVESSISFDKSFVAAK